MAVVKGLVIRSHLEAKKWEICSKRSSLPRFLLYRSIPSIRSGQAYWTAGVQRPRRRADGKASDSLVYEEGFGLSKTSQYVSRIHRSIQGEAIDSEKSLIHEVRREFLADDDRVFPTRIFITQSDPDNLPSSSEHGKSSRAVFESSCKLTACAGDVNLVCSINAGLNPVDLDNFAAKKTPGKISGFKSQPYYQARYKIKIIIGAADLKVELWFKSVQYMEEKFIGIEWEKT